MNRRTKLILVALLQVAVTVSVAAWLLSSVSFRDVLESMSNVDTGWLVAAVLALSAQQFMAANRWSMLTTVLGGARQSLSFYTLWQGVAVLLLQVLPSTIGGDLVRVGSGARSSGLGLGAGVVIVDRVVGMAVLCLLVLGGSALFSNYVVEQPALLIPLAMAVAGISVCALVLAATDWLNRQRFALGLGALGRALKASMAGRPGLLIWSLSLFIHILSVVAVVFLLNASHIGHRDRTALFFVVSAAFLVSALPISLGGWGVREGAFVVGLGLVGVPDAGALGTSVLFGLSLTGAGLVLAFLGVTTQAADRMKRRRTAAL